MFVSVSPSPGHECQDSNSTIPAEIIAKTFAEFNHSISMVSVGPKLIGVGKSRAFRCLWVLEELGIPYQYIPALPQSEEAKKYNPLGKIPILVDECGFSLYESSAIINYLCEKDWGTGSIGHKKNLVPPHGTKERALYEQTMSVLATELDTQALWIHRKHEVMGEFFGYIPDAVEHARKYFNKTNRVLIQQLKDKRLEIGGTDDSNVASYLLGAHFTAADIVYIQCLDWSEMIGWDTKWKDDEVLTNYIKACKSRDSFSRTVTKIKEGKYYRPEKSML